MTDKEYKRTEKLLGKLCKMLGYNRFSLVYGYLQDGYHIRVFNAKGDAVADAASYDLKSTVEQLSQLDAFKIKESL